MSETGFSAEKYIEEQSKYILGEDHSRATAKRLYLEFGGKLVQDKHAMRVLPGFDENAKDQAAPENEGSGGDHHLRILRRYHRPARPDRISVSPTTLEVLRLIDVFQHAMTFDDQQRRGNRGTRTILRRSIALSTDWSAGASKPTDTASPRDIRRTSDTIVSEEGYGANPYIEVTKPSGGGDRTGRRQRQAGDMLFRSSIMSTDRAGTSQIR